MEERTMSIERIEEVSERMEKMMKEVIMKMKEKETIDKENGEDDKEINMMKLIEYRKQFSN